MTKLSGSRIAQIIQTYMEEIFSVEVHVTSTFTVDDHHHAGVTPPPRTQHISISP